MKKLIALGIILLLTTAAYAGLTDTLDTTWTEKEQAESAFTVRAKLQNATNTVDDTLTQIQAIIDSGQFNTLPNDLKVAMLRWLNLYKDLKADFTADAELMELYQWQP